MAEFGSQQEPPTPAAPSGIGTTIAAAAGVGLAGLASSFLFGGKVHHQKLPKTHLV